MSSGDDQAAIAEPMGSPAAPARGRCLRAPPGLGEEGWLRKGVWQCLELWSLWGPSSSSMSPHVSIPFPQDSNLWSRRLLSAPVRCRGMERGCMAAPSFTAIPARLENQLPAPCRAPAPSTSLDPVMGAQGSQEQRWDQGSGLCAFTGAWMDPGNKETHPWNQAELPSPLQSRSSWLD